MFRGWDEPLKFDAFLNFWISRKLYVISKCRKLAQSLISRVHFAPKHKNGQLCSTRYDKLCLNFHLYLNTFWNSFRLPNLRLSNLFATLILNAILNIFSIPSSVLKVDTTVFNWTLFSVDFYITNALKMCLNLNIINFFQRKSYNNPSTTMCSVV